jgi:hypothetical protein
VGQSEIRAALALEAEGARTFTCSVSTLFSPYYLLSLGEDRYLTTVILKHFPQYKTKFTRFAKAKTE